MLFCFYPGVNEEKSSKKKDAGKPPVNEYGRLNKVATFSATNLLSGCISLRCFPLYAQQSHTPGSLTKIWQHGNNASVRFIFCKTQNGILWVLLVILLFSVRIPHHKNPRFLSHFSWATAEGFGLQLEVLWAIVSVRLTPHLENLF